MKLNSTLSGASIPGNVGGELRMFFSSLEQNALDGNGFWQKGPGTNQLVTYVLPNNDQVQLNLSVMTDPIAGAVYLQGAIGVTLAAGGGAGGLMGGLQAPPPFNVGTPHIEIQRGRTTASNGGVNYNLGLDFTIYWDGTFGNCVGTWWAIWQ